MGYEDILAQLNLTDEDRKRAQAMGLLQFGLALMGAPKGAELQAVGNAGLLGVGAYRGELADAGKSRRMGVADQSLAMDLATKRQAYQDEQGLRAGLQSMPAYGPTTGMPSLAPTNTNAATMQTNQAAMTDPAARYNAYADQLDALAQRTGNKAAATMAEQYRDKALKFRDENQTPLASYDPVTNRMKYIQPRKFGQPVDIAGAVPPPDFKEVGLGDKKIFYDPRTGQRGGEFAINVSPDTQYTGDITKRGQNMADARARDANAISQGKPQWDSTAGMFVFPPSAENPAGNVVQPTGYAKIEKPLTESQAKATAFANQMANASTVIDELAGKEFTGKKPGQIMGMKAAGAEGVPYVPGSAAIPRMISSDNAQKYDQAKMQWTEAALRFMTGANAPESEVRRNASTYFPDPGDSPAKIDQKKQMRKAMEESIRMAAGSGTKKLADVAKQIVRRGTAPNGKRVVQYSDGTIMEE